MKLVSPLLVLLVSAPAYALNIAVIVDNSGDGTDEVSFLTSFGHAATEIHDLEDNEMGGAGGTANILALSSYDAVIVSRNTNSGDYDANTAAWNNIDTPLILGAGHIIRNNRWDWQPNNNLVNNSGDTVTVADDTDPIYSGTGLVNGDVFNYSAPSSGAITPAGTTPAGNGTVVGAKTAGGTFIQRWPVGDGTTEFYPGGATYTNERLFFALPNNLSFLTDEGRQMFGNAIFSVVPEPSRAVLLALGAFGLLFRRNRS